MSKLRPYSHFLKHAGLQPTEYLCVDTQISIAAFLRCRKREEEEKEEP